MENRITLYLQKPAAWRGGSLVAVAVDDEAKNFIEQAASRLPVVEEIKGSFQLVDSSETLDNSKAIEWLIGTRKHCQVVVTESELEGNPEFHTTGFISLRAGMKGYEEVVNT